MTTPCHEAAQLRRDIEECSRDKDAQIDSLSHQINGIRGDLMRIDGDIKNMTHEMSEISMALKTIASNTTQFMEVAAMYQNFKGFGFVVKNISLILVGLSASVAAIIVISGIRFSVGG